MPHIHPSVKMGHGVLIEGEVAIEAGCEIGAYSIITGSAHIGSGNKFSPHSIIGGEPQDRKFKGGGRLVIGNDNIFREFTTVHRGHLTPEGTIIGNGNYFLTAAHVGHDCRVGNGNFIANQVLLAGHVEIGNHVNISGMAGFHQFCRVGDYAMISGLSGLRQDVYPYAMVQGDPGVQRGINKVGLSRNGFSAQDIRDISEAFRILRNGLDLEAGQGNKFLEILLQFREKSDRGMIKMGMYKRQ